MRKQSIAVLLTAVLLTGSSLAAVQADDADVELIQTESAEESGEDMSGWEDVQSAAVPGSDVTGDASLSHFQR